MINPTRVGISTYTRAPTRVTTIYFASVEDRATHFCNLDCHDTAPPAKVIIYLEVDFLESTSPIVSASV